MRIFSVTGTATARTVAARIAAAAASSRISAEPACWPSATFFTGQPKLMSIRSAPRSTASRAASAIASGLAAGELERADATRAIHLGHRQRLLVLADHRPGGDHL